MSLVIDNVEVKVVLTTSLPHTFRCNNCGLCCEGPVELTERDYTRVKQLAAERGLRLVIEEKPGVTRKRIIMKPLQRQELLQECTFLVHRGGQRLCSIYEQRPCFCRLYPVFIGYSRHTREIYADVIHCPGVEHGIGDGELLDEKNIARIVKEILEFDSDFINIVPNLDRAVPFSQHPKFRDLFLAWPLKFALVRQLNSILEKLLDSCENLVHVIYTVSRFQQQVCEGIKACSNIFELPSVVEKQQVRHVSLDEIMRTLKECLNKAELLIGNEVVLLDNYSKTVYGVKLELSELKNIEIVSEDLVFMKEMLKRFTCLFQTVALPLEYMYVRGLLVLLVIYLLYSSVCEEFKSVLYNFDAVGLSVYTRYVIEMLKDLGLAFIIIDLSRLSFV